MHKTLDAELVEKRLHLPADFLHQLEVGEQDERFAVGQFHKVFDPVNQRVRVTGLARVGHFVRDKYFHLLLVIERRTHLQRDRPLGANALDEILQCLSPVAFRRWDRLPACLFSFVLLNTCRRRFTLRPLP